MGLISRLFQLLPNVCSHPHTYRERRKLHGTLVMHLVCERCGHATPAMDRTARDHRRVVQLGDQPNARIVQEDGKSGQVVQIGRQPRRKRA